MGCQRAPGIEPLSWKVRTDATCGFNQLLYGHLDPLSAVFVITWIMRSTSLTPGSIERSELRRPDAPLTALLSRHDMQVKVWRFLAAIDTVVLKREYPERLESVHQCFRNSLRCTRNSR